jgi:pyruvate/2-oxoglutarate dehydrogenase complex dihydrolipoamide dehydrogenase (E3) component
MIITCTFQNKIIGVIALEMAQAFSLLGSEVTVINRSSRLFESKLGDPEAAAIIQTELEKVGERETRRHKINIDAFSVINYVYMFRFYG